MNRDDLAPGTVDIPALIPALVRHGVHASQVIVAYALEGSARLDDFGRITVRISVDPRHTPVGEYGLHKQAALIVPIADHVA